MDTLRTGLSYDDVLLVPHRSPVDSRDEVDLSTNLTPSIELENPLLSAPMDTVTEAETAIELSRIGGFGTIHRFLSIEEQLAEVRAVRAAGERVGAAVGISEDYLERAEQTIEAGAVAVMVDVAHGHLERALDAVSDIEREFPDVDLIAGNVATAEGVQDLAAAGADAVKVGIGPGSHCTTRVVAGAGVPQLTAVSDAAEAAADLDVRIIADGGIRNSGDATKALLAGADTVMMGRFFAAMKESPGEIVEVDGEQYTRSRGMATTAANDARTDKENSEPTADEGVEALTPLAGPLAEVTTEFLAGIRSGLSYVGAATIPAARDRAEFIQVAPGARRREGAHFDHDWENPTVE
ncbi:guanosine monophosphate reductase [Halodesulfurarchaeum formicicum]|uniref:Guanosine monophosphate reductase n=1 Tax=Halodesulfurarchaeum formicicum TaxID=1873524 RepID=A0A1J1ADQ4_9EURY|nr:guanosine monophosphate reductase [Halodesulfurarchaeum formicicum]APE95855.1 guanosine monophosphate reductase [Halodesulfurarchaeum formicicum]